MKTTASLTSNTTVELGSVVRVEGRDIWEATVAVYGTFGSGTVTLQMSPDGGTTKINLRDTSGALVSITANDAYNVRLGLPSKLGEEIKLYATLTGATGPTLAVAMFDNR